MVICKENLDVKAFFFPLFGGVVKNPYPVLPTVPIKFREIQQMVSG